VLEPLCREAISKATAGEREHHSTTRRRERADQHERDRRHVGLQSEEDQHRPSRRPKRRQQVHAEHDADKSQISKHQGEST
jgi:hypothetical protein